MTTRLPFEYSTINVNALSEEELGTSKNPFAWALFVAKQALMRGPDREERLLEKKWFLFQKLYDNGLLKNLKLQALLRFMENYLPFEDQKTSRIFRMRIDQLIGKTTTMDMLSEQIIELKWEDGIRKGLKKGKRQAREEFVRELLAKTEFSDAKIASLTKVTALQVARIRKKLQAK